MNRLKRDGFCKQNKNGELESVCAPEGSNLWDQVAKRNRRKKRGELSGAKSATVKRGACAPDPISRLWRDRFLEGEVGERRERGVWVGKE
jgi:hypothetical protein